MGGSSKQTVGYKYFFGVHMGIGRGPVDALHEIRVADKQAWYGRATGNTTIRINKPELFGGEEKEGGVAGPLELMMGGADQEASSGLKAMLGSILPGFRGAFTAFYNGLVCMNNPYPKPWKFRLNRVLKGWDGAVWHPTKAQIRLDPTIPPPAINIPAVLTRMLFGVSATAPTTSPRTYTIPVTDASAILSGTYLVWVGRRPFAPSLDIGKGFRVRVLVDGISFWEKVITYDGSTEQAVKQQLRVTSTNPTFSVECTPLDNLFGGTLSVALVGIDSATEWAPISQELTVDPDDTYSFGYVLNNLGQLRFAHFSLPGEQYVWGNPNQGDLNVPCAMNPAHIIYECLTNRAWGRGLSASKLDLDSFMAAADMLYAEDFGLCLKWTRKDSIENFIQGVIDHIGATLYVSRTTKLYTIKLMRGGYNLNDLPLFDTESGIMSISDASVASIGSTVNAVQVKYHDWENDEERTVSVKNAAAIVAAGGVVNQVTRDFPGIPVASLALRVAQRELRAVSTALRKFTITMDRRGEDFAPGDVLAIQDPKRGVPKMAVRVGRVEDGTLLDGKITLTVVQDVFTLPATTMAADVPSTWVPPNNTPCVDQQRVFEAPYFLVVRTMSKADLDYVGPDSGYIATLNSRGQPLNQGYKIAVRPDAPTSDDNPPNDSYVCGI